MRSTTTGVAWSCHATERLFALGREVSSKAFMEELCSNVGGYRTLQGKIVQKYWEYQWPWTRHVIWAWDVFGLVLESKSQERKGLLFTLSCFARNHEFQEASSKSIAQVLAKARPALLWLVGCNCSCASSLLGPPQARHRSFFPGTETNWELHLLKYHSVQVWVEYAILSLVFVWALGGHVMMGWVKARWKPTTAITWGMVEQCWPCSSWWDSQSQSRPAFFDSKFCNKREQINFNHEM